MNNVNDNLNNIAEQYMLEVIKNEHPEWVEEDGSCRRCEEYYYHLDDLVDFE